MNTLPVEITFCNPIQSRVAGRVSPCRACLKCTIPIHPITEIAKVLLALTLFSSPPAQAVTILTVPVGHPGNANDSADGDIANPGIQNFGAAPYAYNIGTYEVTNAQYAEFLNFKARSDPSGLYQTLMGSHARGGISRSGSSPNFTYATRTNMADKPVNFVSFYDCLRFANWLNNGQEVGDTETGAYTLSSGTSVSRNAGATWFLPSENEWYKAAYYDPRTEIQGGPIGNDNYWHYPSLSNSVPARAAANSVGDISNPGTNVANYDLDADWNAQDGNITTVGSAGALSDSYYGSSDQGGNVWEWNEQPFSGLSHRGLRGGSWQNPADHMAASFRYHVGASDDYDTLGFRVANIPEPQGDFDNDGDFDCYDVDVLVAEIAAGTNAGSLDLTGDALVNQQDLTAWRTTAGSVNLPSGHPYLQGDANLDGAVDGSDFGIWNGSKFTNVAAWCSGDFSADGVVDGSDFGIWNSNKFTSSDGTAVVPEPSTFVLVAGLPLLILALRKRGTAGRETGSRFRIHKKSRHPTILGAVDRMGKSMECFIADAQ